MKLWQPHRRQWRVLWGVYAIAFVFSVDWQYFDPPMESVTFIGFIIIAGVLVIWRMQGEGGR